MEPTEEFVIKWKDILGEVLGKQDVWQFFSLVNTLDEENLKSVIYDQFEGNPSYEHLKEAFWSECKLILHPLSTPAKTEKRADPNLQAPPRRQRQKLNVREKAHTSRNLFPDLTVQNIDGLQPNTTAIIKVKVEDKSNIINYENKKTGKKEKFFYIIFSDENETKVRCTAYNAVAEQFFDVLQLGKRYSVHVHVREADERYKRPGINDRVELTLQKDSKVTPFEDEEERETRKRRRSEGVDNDDDKSNVYIPNDSGSRKSRLTLYLRTPESDVYHAVYLNEIGRKELRRKLSAVVGVPENQIHEIYMQGPNGIRVFITDEVIENTKAESMFQVFKDENNGKLAFILEPVKI